MLKINGLNKTFNPHTTEAHQVFDSFSMEVKENESIAIIGPNGCGKSTFFNLISGSLKEDAGEIVLGGVDITKLEENERSRYIGKVNQDPSKGVSPNLTVLENMALSLKKGQNFKMKSLIKNTDQDRIKESLKELGLGLENKLNTRVSLLSGGQRQCLSLLMTTMVRPSLLLLDEHTAALDPKTSSLIMDKTRDLIFRENITTLMITHNLGHAVDYADRIIMFSKGEIAFDIDSDSVDELELHTMYNNIVQAEMM